jgi:histidinol-phosphate phosphatase family protein
MTTAVVLAGGFGTRLRTVVADRPKVLVPVAGRRFLAYLLDQLADAGLQQAILCTGYLGAQVREAFGERWRTVYLKYSQEQEPLGTAGALRQALDMFPTDEMLVLNGDSFCDVDLRALTHEHRRRRAAATMVVTEVSDVSRYGAVNVDSSGAISGFVEKGIGGPGLVNAGVYVLDAAFVAAIPRGPQVSIERDWFPQRIGKDLCAFRVNGHFVDVGTPESYATAQNDQRLFGSSGGYSSRPYALLDRDGTVNVERNYLSHPDQIELLPGVTEGMRKLRALGMGIVIVSNQSGVGRGYFDVGELARIHNRLRALLGEADLAVDGVYYCPHIPEAKCVCRKPEVGMILQAATDLGFDPGNCFVVGDKPCDIEMGRRLNATTMLVQTGYGRQSAANGVQPAYFVNDLSEAADLMADVLQSRCSTSAAIN